MAREDFVSRGEGGGGKMEETWASLLMPIGFDLEVYKT